MVFSPNDANIPNLGSISSNLGKLSANDADDSLGLGAPRQPIFERLEFPTNDRVDSSSGQQSVEPFNEKKHMLKRERLKGLLPTMSSESVQAK
jgi:hypothetical protein